MASRALLSLGDRAERPFSLTPVTCGPDGLGSWGPNGPLWTQLDPTFAQHPPPDHPASIPQGKEEAAVCGLQVLGVWGTQWGASMPRLLLGTELCLANTHVPKWE